MMSHKGNNLLCLKGNESIILDGSVLAVGFLWLERDINVHASVDI